MDPAIILFGFGVGFLVGLTGMGGGTLMTPMLILIFGVKPVTAIGTDIFYAAITKTVGGWRHLKLGTVNLPLSYWMAAGSVPSAIGGVWVLEYLKGVLGDNLDEFLLGVLAAALIVVGIATLFRQFVIRDRIPERADFTIRRRHKIAAVTIGALTGFIIGLSSAGSGTLIAIMLIAVFRLVPQRVVGTDVFHAAILLWAAGLAHVAGGNVDFLLAGNILLGSVPGVVIGSQLSVRSPTMVLRTILSGILITAGLALFSKADTNVIPVSLAVSALLLAMLFAAQIALQREVAPAERGLDSEGRKPAPGRRGWRRRLRFAGASGRRG